jgi:cell division protein FtsI/penicillin-binding protein 2
MSDNSPMMRRVRSGKPFSYKLPRKGRIRLVLIILIIIVAVKIGFNSFRSDVSKPNTAMPVTEKNAVKKDTAKKVRVKKVKTKKTPFSKKKHKEPAITEVKVKKVDSITVTEVAGILKQHSPTFQNQMDTIIQGKKTLIVNYTLDSSLQVLGMKLMKQYRPLYGAIVAIHPNSGRILSLISYKNDSVPDLGRLYSRSIFPAASVYKTITAAAAIERAHIGAQSIVHHTGRSSTLYKYQLERDLKGFREIPFEEAYAFSINPVFARIGMYFLGNGVLGEYGQRFGFNETVPFELETEASNMSLPDSTLNMAELASGFNQSTTLSPLHGALLASAISEKGMMPRPLLVDSILVSDSCIYKARRETWRTPIKESTAMELRSMMRCVSKYGTARKSFRYLRDSHRFNDIDYGGKTGSVDKDSIGRVDWFIGFARNPVDPKQRIAVGIVTVHGAYWTVHSSYLAAEYFRNYLRTVQLEQEKIQKERSVLAPDTVSTGAKKKAQL